MGSGRIALRAEFCSVVADPLRLLEVPERSLTMPSIKKIDTHHKALTLNLDPSSFGSFAEIGAGQEVARWFLVVGGRTNTSATLEE